jgi:hypothetical protein
MQARHRRWWFRRYHLSRKTRRQATCAHYCAHMNTRRARTSRRTLPSAPQSRLSRQCHTLVRPLPIGAHGRSDRDEIGRNGNAWLRRLAFAAAVAGSTAEDQWKQYGADVPKTIPELLRFVDDASFVVVEVPPSRTAGIRNRGHAASQREGVDGHAEWTARVPVPFSP